MFGEPSATCRGGRVSVSFRVFRGSKKIYTLYTDKVRLHEEVLRRGAEVA